MWDVEAGTAVQLVQANNEFTHNLQNIARCLVLQELYMMINERFNNFVAWRTSLHSAIKFDIS